MVFLFEGSPRPPFCWCFFSPRSPHQLLKASSLGFFTLLACEWAQTQHFWRTHSHLPPSKTFPGYWSQKEAGWCSPAFFALKPIGQRSFVIADNSQQPATCLSLQATYTSSFPRLPYILWLIMSSHHWERHDCHTFTLFWKTHLSVCLQPKQYFQNI